MKRPIPMPTPIFLSANPSLSAKDFHLSPTSAASGRVELIMDQFWRIRSQKSFIFNDEFFKKRK
jgi:hypothetical protein